MTTPARVVLTAVIVELTVATAYIHANMGGLLFSLNALGFMALAAAYAFVAAPLPIARRFGWLPRIGLAGYALLTIGAYLVMGPYFPLGWIAKGIEVAIIGLVIVDVITVYDNPIGLMRAAVGSLGGLLRAVIVLLALTAAVAACSSTSASAGSTDAADADVTITSREMTFDLATLTASAGQPFTVRLVNLEEVPHNVAIALLPL